MVSCRKIISALMLIVLAVKKCECGVYSIFRDLLQWNVAGIPSFHRVTEWDFDPEVSQKRRDQFYDLHGFRAAKLIDRIGTGIDGKNRDRAYNYALRDEGRLQGLNLLRP